MPRAGTSYWIVTCPSLVTDDISIMEPLRSLRREMAEPEYSSGISTSTSSNGSICTPSMFFSITVGGPTIISKLSRRIVSMRTVRCSRPRPETRTVSPSSVSSTRIATFVSSSLLRRSRICRPVRYLAPDLPANGDLFTPMVIDIVGCSTVIGSRGIGLSISTRVSPMLKSGMPAKVTISPALASSIGARPAASKAKSSEILT
mmetsp:Transcript_7636/g.19976  ORF Transcript_7636/g.19976 Transcript_7636/m.19976 type:complete len:203 (-) Transcript_7636:361-969(-)